MPTRFIHSRSALMPSLVMLPFIQCHQTRGLALSGGFSKPRRNGSPEFCAETIHVPTMAAANAVQPALLIRMVLASPIFDNMITPVRVAGFGPL